MYISFLWKPSSNGREKTFEKIIKKLVVNWRIVVKWRMSSKTKHHGNGNSDLATNRTKRRRKNADHFAPNSNGAVNVDQMVPKIRVVSGGYEPVRAFEEDRSTSLVENGDVFNQVEEHKQENGALVGQSLVGRDVESCENLIKGGHGETSFTIAFEVLIPFLIAGLGTVGAGLLLDKVQV